MAYLSLSPCLPIFLGLGDTNQHGARGQTHSAGAAAATSTPVQATRARSPRRGGKGTGASKSKPRASLDAGADPNAEAGEDEAPYVQVRAF